MLQLKNGEKVITLYGEKLKENKEVPIVIYNSFDGNGKELWNKCKELECNEFILASISNIIWDDEMTPWECQPLYKGDMGCKGKADDYLIELIEKIIPQIENRLNYKPKYYTIAGCSLGGLFAIYSLYKTNIFKKIVSVSGSFWYPDFIEYAKENEIVNIADEIYMSLGNKEKEAKNKVFATVEKKTLELVEFYKSKNINIKFEFNEGNHYKDTYMRLAKGIKNCV